MDSALSMVLRNLLPPPLLTFLDEHILNPASPAQYLKRNFLTSLSYTYATLLPILTPLLDRATQYLHSSPDIVVLAVLLGIFLIALKVLLFVRRVIAFWTRLAFRAVFWAGAAMLLAAAWQRGPEACARDAAVIAGKVAGWAIVVKDVWVREYRRYEEEQGAGARASGRGYQGQRRNW